MSICAEACFFGVEEEYQIIDPVTRELCSSAEPILLAAQKVLGSCAQHEIHLSQLEIATPICQTLSMLREELTRLRRGVIAAAAHFNKQIAASGSHPFSHWQRQSITPKERYQLLEQDFQQLVREQSIFGCHVHVGISDRSVALQVLNHARTWLSPLLALTANSPFWWGTDTGYSSYRHVMWTRWPQAGPPQVFSSMAEYEALSRALLATRCIDDLSKIYWDIRLSEHYPTIEVRLMDVCTSIDEVVMIAGLVRALIRTCYEQVVQGKEAPPVRQELLRLAHWRAARYGLDEDLVDVHSESILPARQLITNFLHFLRPALEASCDWVEVSTLVQQTMRQGIGASRQRAIFQQTGQLESVVDLIVSETAQGTT